MLPLTENTPQCLALVGGEPILARTIKALSRHHIFDAAIVVGHLEEQIKAAIGPVFAGVRITYITVEDYATTNNIVSLWLAREQFISDTLLIEGDVVFDDEIIRRLLSAGPQSMAVMPRTKDLIGSYVRVDDYIVTSLVLGNQKDSESDFTGTFKTVNLCYLSSKYLRDSVIPLLEDSIACGDVHSYYESVFQRLIATTSEKLRAVNINDCLWWEVDTMEDLGHANTMFHDNNDYGRVTAQYGGYWRYNFADHCNLYNLYFSPEPLIERLKDKFADIVLNCPPGQARMAELVANWIGISPEHVVVGNGS